MDLSKLTRQEMRTCSMLLSEGYHHETCFEASKIFGKDMAHILGKLKQCPLFLTFTPSRTRQDTRDTHTPSAALPPPHRPLQKQILVLWDGAGTGGGLVDLGT